MKTPDEIKKGLECCFFECDDTSPVDHCRACPYRPNGLCFRSLITDALAYIQQLEDHIRDLTKKVPKWISVEERLPENCVEVLLYYKKGYLSMGYWDDDLCEWDGMTDEKIVRPDYWMPLPEPLKEEEHK